MAYEATLIDGLPSELRVYAGEPKNSVNSIRDSICAGAYDEDADRDPRLTTGISTWQGLFNWGTHFWKPDAGPEGGLLEKVGDFPVNLEAKNAYQRARDLYADAKAVYSDDPQTAYHLLGRVVHLLTDMATPAHVHLDVHISGASKTGDDSLEEYTAALYVSPGLSAGRAAFESDFPVSGLLPSAYRNLPEGGQPGEPFLFRLFYDMAKTAEGFDSDDADGSFDRGSRRGKSVVMLNNDLLEAVLLCSGREFPLPLWAYQLSPSRNKFVLPDSVFNLLIDTGRCEGIRLNFPHASVVYTLSNFTSTDIGDSDTFRISNSLIPRALENIAGLYRLFWDETHPSMLYDESPLISFQNGAGFLQIYRPEPLEVELDIAPNGWNATEVEAYLWVEFPVDGENKRFYFDGQWNPFTVPSEIRPGAGPVRLGKIEDASLRILDETSLMPEISFRLNLCVDRVLDSHYSPSESVCSSIAIRLN